MSTDQEVLNVVQRDWRGSARSRQRRKSGQIPAILYGHGQESVSLTIDARELSTALKHRAKLVQLKGASTETAFLKKVQWDVFFNNVLHVDLTRVDASEMVEVKLPITLRGIAPGTKMGGHVELAEHSIMIECPASEIPETLELSINELEFDQVITAADLTLPKGAKLIGEEDAADWILVTCHEAVVREEDEDEAGVDGAEPEVVGEKTDEEGDS